MMVGITPFPTMGLNRFDDRMLNWLNLEEKLKAEARAGLMGMGEGIVGPGYPCANLSDDGVTCLDTITPQPSTDPNSPDYVPPDTGTYDPTTGTYTPAPTGGGTTVNVNIPGVPGYKGPTAGIPLPPGQRPGGYPAPPVPGQLITGVPNSVLVLGGAALLLYVIVSQS